jgi:hypothetical protein
MTRAPQHNACKRAAKSIKQSRLAVEKLIDQTPKDDHHALGLLGPILAELRNAQDTLEQLTRSSIP